MNEGKIFFLSAIGFLGGVFVASFISEINLILVFVALIFGTTLGGIILEKKFLSPIILFSCGAFGAAYFLIDDFNFKNSAQINFGKEQRYCGEIISDIKRSNLVDKLTIKISEGGKGKISISIPPFSSVNYGNQICFSGTIKKPEGNYANYLAKEKISGTGQIRKIEIIKSDGGNIIQKFLYGIKNKMISTLQKLLNPEQESLVSGIILGDDERLNAENKEAMKKSNTTHITALSGYNISLLVSFLSLPLLFISKRFRFFGLIIFILFFVLMTGAEASIVRAALMAITINAAKKYERIHNGKNAILVAATFLVLWNPKFLVFDLGFQLSFLAFLGISFLAPKIYEWIDFESKVLKEAVIPSFSAQLAVLLIIMINFGKFSLLSVIPNILILWIVPVLTVIGFIAAILGSIWLPLGILPAKISGVLAESIFAIVENFIKINPIVEILFLGLIILTILFLVFKKKDKWKNESK